MLLEAMVQFSKVRTRWLPSPRMLTTETAGNTWTLVPDIVGPSHRGDDESQQDSEPCLPGAPHCHWPAPAWLNALSVRLRRPDALAQSLSHWKKSQPVVLRVCSFCQLPWVEWAQESPADSKSLPIIIRLCNAFPENCFLSFVSFMRLYFIESKRPQSVKQEKRSCRWNYASKLSYFLGVALYTYSKNF